MATAITINGSVMLDESSGLQNTGVPAGAEDNNDSDVAFSIASTPLPTSFSNRLFNSAANGGLGLSTTFATNNGVAESASNFIQVSAGSGSTVANLGFVKADGSALPVTPASLLAESRPVSVRSTVAPSASLLTPRSAIAWCSGWMRTTTLCLRSSWIRTRP